MSAMKCLLIAFGVALATSTAQSRPIGELRKLSDAEKSIIRAAVEAKLKDPSSAQYQWFKYNGQSHYCGRLNAKNAYGGYIGFYEFNVDVQRDASGKIISASDLSYHIPDAPAAEMMRKICITSAKADTEDRQPVLE